MRKINMSPKKKWTIEDLRIQEGAIQSTFQWWEKSIKEKTSKLEKLCSSEDNNFQEIESLQNEIEQLQKKGQIEQKILDNFEKEKQAYLMNNLVSGALDIKWGNE